MKTLSIIIVNWNTMDLLAQCLKSVDDTVQSLDHEIIVVDNGSTDGSPEMVRGQFPHVLLIENQENLGFARANNQAIRISQGKYILLLNSDAFLQDDAAGQMVYFLDQTPSAGIVGANLFYPDGSAQVSYGPLPSLYRETLSLLGLDKLKFTLRRHGLSAFTIEPVETERVSGACLMVRRSVLDEIGLLDESFFFFSEEIDFCYRTYKSGWKIYHLPEAHVVHVVGGSEHQPVQRILRLYSGKLHYFYKHFGSNAERNLRYLMVITAISKGLFYRLVRLLSLGFVRKDNFWWAVSKELSKTLA